MKTFQLLSLRTRRLLAALFIAPGLLMVQGCTDQEVLATVGVIAVVGGAVAIGAAVNNNNNHHHHHYNNHYRPRPPHHGYGYGGYGRPPRPWNISETTEKVMTPLTELSTADELNAVSLVATRYQLPLSSAASLQKTLKATVDTQSLQPLYDLGLSRTDLMDIGQYKMISNTGLRNVAQKLDITESQVKVVVQRMMDDAQQNGSVSNLQ